MSKSRALPIVILILFVLLSSTLGSSQDFLGSKIISQAQLPTGAAILASGDINGDGTADLVYSIAY